MTSKKIHNKLLAPSTAFKLAYAGPDMAILEGIEFKAKTASTDGSRFKSLRLAIYRLWPRRRTSARPLVRAYDAQQVRLSTFKDIALPMVLNPGDQFFICAKAPDLGRATDCTLSDDDNDDRCDEVEMIGVRLRGNFIPVLFFTIEDWAKFPY